MWVEGGYWKMEIAQSGAMKSRTHTLTLLKIAGVMLKPICEICNEIYLYSLSKILSRLFLCV